LGPLKHAGDLISVQLGSLLPREPQAGLDACCVPTHTILLLGPSPATQDINRVTVKVDDPYTGETGLPGERKMMDGTCPAWWGYRLQNCALE
jgi:hypothetical protein